MKRWHEEVSHYKRQREVSRRYESVCNCVSENCWCKKQSQMGRYRKRHALDCGKPHCMVCHCGKFPKRELTEQEVKCNISQREQMRDF